MAQHKLPLAIFLDGEAILDQDGHVIAPAVQSKITNSGQVTGLNAADIDRLVKLLNSGALPAPLRIVSTPATSQQ
jgi:preprotein translocase subunit SecD